MSIYSIKYPVGTKVRVALPINEKYDFTYDVTGTIIDVTGTFDGNICVVLFDYPVKDDDERLHTAMSYNEDELEEIV